MSNMRIKFTRGDEVKYISHLDLVKVFERTLRRAHLPIAYSQGFNPHPQMVFGLPLSVGVTSESEFADFEFTEDIQPEKFITAINKELPQGIRIIDAKTMNSRSNIMKYIAAANYSIVVSLDDKTDINVIEDSIKAFMSRDEVMVVKEGKSGSKNINIRPMVHSVEVKECKAVDADKYQDSNNTFCFMANVSAGSTSNLRPEFLIDALKAISGLDMETESIHRIALFVDMNGKILDPLSLDALSVV